MAQKFESKYESILEGFGGPISKKDYAPRIPLSEDFKKAFKAEFKRLCEPVPVVNEEGETVSVKEKKPSKILEQMQKALVFLAR